MAATYSTQFHAPTGTIKRAIMNIVSQITDRVSTNAIRSELSHLSDRELNDIGLSRADIQSVGMPRR